MERLMATTAPFGRGIGMSGEMARLGRFGQHAAHIQNRAANAVGLAAPAAACGQSPRGDIWNMVRRLCCRVTSQPSSLHSCTGPSPKRRPLSPAALNSASTRPKRARHDAQHRIGRVRQRQFAHPAFRAGGRRQFPAGFGIGRGDHQARTGLRRQPRRGRGDSRRTRDDERFPLHGRHSQCISPRPRDAVSSGW